MEGPAPKADKVVSMELEDKDAPSEAVLLDTGATPGPASEFREPGRRKRVLREKAKRMIAEEEEKDSDGSPAAEDGTDRKTRRRRSLQQDDHMEALVAAGMGFPHDHLTEEEIRAGVVGALGGIEQANYIVIRNHILAKWRQNVDKWLPESLILENIRAEHKPLVRAAYRFLSQAGYINFGVCPAIKERVRTGAPKSTMIVIGAGLAGLAAARQLVAFGHKVIILEGRGRPGGRVHTRQMGAGGHSAAADLGGSVLTGTDGNPLGVLARQLKLPMHHIRSDPCPIYGLDGRRVDEDLDQQVEDDFNKLLDRAEETRTAIATVADSISLGSTLDTLRRSHRVAQAEDERQLLDWHMANLEYANAGLLHDLSLAYWDQDDPHEMAGDHCFLSGGNGRLVSALADGLPIFYGRNVQTVRYSDSGVRVQTSDGQVFEGDMALSTIPLGCMKRGDVTFDPPLPREKEAAIRRLGFGLLNKVALLFPHNFWGTDLDTFGRVAPDAARRGEYFLFYSYAAVSGGSLLIALVAGEAAKRFEKKPSIDVIAEVMTILRSIYEPQGVEVPNPLTTLCTRWGSDPYAYGSYSHVAVGSSGDDYDVMAESCGNGRLFFAGEATTRWHPATMHGALLTGLREAGWMDATAAARAAGQPLPVQIAPSSLSAQAVTLAEVFRDPDMEFGGFSVVLDPRSSSPSAPALLRLILRSVHSLTKPIKMPQDALAEPIHTLSSSAKSQAAPNGPSTMPTISSTAPVHTLADPLTAAFLTGERTANAKTTPVDASSAATCTHALPDDSKPPLALPTAVGVSKPFASKPGLSSTALGSPTEGSMKYLNGSSAPEPILRVPAQSNLANSQAVAKPLQASDSQQAGSSGRPTETAAARTSTPNAVTGGFSLSQNSTPPLETTRANQGLKPAMQPRGDNPLGSGPGRPLGNPNPGASTLQMAASQQPKGASVSLASLGSDVGFSSTAPGLPIVKDGRKGVLLPPTMVAPQLDTGAVLERRHESGPVHPTVEAPIHTSSAVPRETGKSVGGAQEQPKSQPSEPFSFPGAGNYDSLRGETSEGKSQPVSTVPLGRVAGREAEANSGADGWSRFEVSVDGVQGHARVFGGRYEPGLMGSGGDLNRQQQGVLGVGVIDREPFHKDPSSHPSAAKPHSISWAAAGEPSPPFSKQHADVRLNSLDPSSSGPDAQQTSATVADKFRPGLASKSPFGNSNVLPNERGQALVSDSPVNRTTETPSEPSTVGATPESASSLPNDSQQAGPVSHVDGKLTVSKATPNGKPHPGAKKAAAVSTGKKRGKKRRHVEQADVFTPQRELAVYTVITRGQAEQLREVKGGEKARLRTLVETFGVKLVGRHGLGSAGASLLAALNGPHLVAGGLLPREQADAIKAGKAKKVPQENGVKPPLQLRPKRPKLEKGPVKTGSKEARGQKAAVTAETVSVTSAVNATSQPDMKDAMQILALSSRP